MNSKKQWFTACIVIVMLSCWAVINNVTETTAAANGTIYYVDAENGNDSNTGTSKEQSWKTLEKVNANEFQPGDQVKFKSGGIWEGVFEPKGSGEKGAPIIYTSYGDGPKPAFVGEESAPYVIKIFNQEYVELHNLDISANYETKRERNAIYVEMIDFGTVHNLHFVNLDIHDVKHNLDYQNNNSYKTTGGMFFWIKGKTTPTKFDGLVLEGNTLKNVDRTGVMLTWSSWTNRGGLNKGMGRWYPSTNVELKNNYLENIGGDGIIIQGTEGAVVKNNVINGFAERNQGITYNAGMWSHNADNTLFEYNEGFNGKTIKDGMPWDSDGLSNGTVFQYNYSHDNEGGAALFISYTGKYGDKTIAHESKDSVFRYNISQNDKFALITGASPESGQVYNNVFYIGKDRDVKAFNHTYGNLDLKNNIYYVDEGGRLEGNWAHTGDNYNFDSNLYYGNITSLPNDPNKVTEDPKFVEAGQGKSGDANGAALNTLDGYKLQADSAAIDQGTYVTHNGGKDFWDNALYSEKPDIGVHEYVKEGDNSGEDATAEGENLLNDPGFESGTLAEKNTKDAWAGYGDRKINDAQQRSGSFAAQIGGSNPTGLNYEITTLKPHTKYKLSGWLKMNKDNATASFAVRDYEGPNTDKRIVKTVKGTDYQEYTIEFTTGESEYAWFYLYKGAGQADDYVLADDFTLTELSPVKEFKNELDQAKELVDQAVIGYEEGQYPQGALKSFQIEVKNAEEKYNNYTLFTTEELDQAIKEIKAARNKFNSHQVSGSTGDLNGDGIVDITDLAIISKYSGATSEQDTWNTAKKADITGDGKIDFRDYIYLSKILMNK